MSVKPDVVRMSSRVKVTSLRAIPNLAWLPIAGHVHVLHVRGKARVGMELTFELGIEG